MGKMDREMEQGKARAEKEGDREKQRDTERLREFPDKFKEF